MKVLDLQCAQGHNFEGWFSSEQDFRQQTGSGLLACPLCGQTRITRLLSAPRLNLRGGDGGNNTDQAADSVSTQGNESSPAPANSAPGMPVALQVAWLRMVRHMLTHTEDVGQRFADEARRIHYGQAPERGIRGKASPAETEALLDEGIAVLPLPIPDGMDGPVQ
ncbi:MAG: DUF1178 family protein [Burkholderiaceae bacterium]|jgi:hypothetical protein|nr:DUF1178 family protein [Burkholderiaceae bacterium]